MSCHVDATEWRRRKVSDNRRDESDVMSLAPSERELEGEEHVLGQNVKRKEERTDRERRGREKEKGKRCLCDGDRCFLVNA